MAVSRSAESTTVSIFSFCCSRKIITSVCQSNILTNYPPIGRDMLGIKLYMPELVSFTTILSE